MQPARCDDAVSDHSLAVVHLYESLRQRLRDFPLSCSQWSLTQLPTKAMRKVHPFAFLQEFLGDRLIRFPLFQLWEDLKSFIKLFAITVDVPHGG